MKKTLVLIAGMLIATATVFAQNPAIQVTKTGKGSPIIFLPGFTCPGSVWNETIEHLDKKHENHIVSYAGFNGVAPIEMPWYATIKKELVAYIEKGDMKNVTIIGHSMGGTLAADIASEIPNRIKSLILVDALASMRDLMLPNVPVENIQYESPYNKQMLAMGPDDQKKYAVMMATNMTNIKSKHDVLVDWSMTSDRKTFVYGYTDLLKVDIRGGLSKITSPVLILGASFPDKAVVTETFNKQYANLPNKTIEIAPDSRHFVMWDQADWFYSKVNAFLSK